MEGKSGKKNIQNEGDDAKTVRSIKH